MTEIGERAWKRGGSCGTILCDSEKGCGLDLLLDSGVAIVSAWLKRRPNMAVIARDRATLFDQVSYKYPEPISGDGICVTIATMGKCDRFEHFISVHRDQDGASDDPPLAGLSHPGGEG